MRCATDTTAYSYDGLGRLTGIAYPSGIGVGYGYNAASQLLAITATVNGVTTTVAAPSGYQLFGPAETQGALDHPMAWVFGQQLLKPA
jgi:YD repeat-containing protein